MPDPLQSSSDRAPELVVNNHSRSAPVKENRNLISPRPGGPSSMRLPGAHCTDRTTVSRGGLRGRGRNRHRAGWRRWREAISGAETTGLRRFEGLLGGDEKEKKRAERDSSAEAAA